MFSQEKFSARLIQLRAEKGVSQAGLAKEIGLGRSAVSLMEIGERAASVEALCLLADYFNVSLDYLVGRSDDPVRR